MHVSCIPHRLPTSWLFLNAGRRYRKKRFIRASSNVGSEQFYKGESRLLQHFLGGNARCLVCVHNVARLLHSWQVESLKLARKLIVIPLEIQRVSDLRDCATYFPRSPAASA